MQRYILHPQPQFITQNVPIQRISVPQPVTNVVVNPNPPPVRNIVIQQAQPPIQQTQPVMQQTQTVIQQTQPMIQQVQDVTTFQRRQQQITQNL